jgi:glycosyltransferase involved in cell wall biosynthesis
MLADMQRARMLAWELPKLGWEVEVLAPLASEIRQDAVDPDSNDFFPKHTPVHEVGSFCRSGFEMIGSRTHSWRTLPTIYWRGCQLLASKNFALVYFSTTTFVYFVLGSCWFKRFGIPYVLDFHDPWVKQETVKGESLIGWKRRIARGLSAKLERSAVVNAAGLVAVSPKYIESLSRRYAMDHPAWLAPEKNAVIPFATLPTDLVEARKLMPQDTATEGAEIAIHYVGAGGAIMARSFSLICRTLMGLRAENNPLVNRVRIRLYGTTYDWKTGDAKLLEGIAQHAGVGDLIVEQPERVSYRRSLELLLKSDGALILGVDDVGYMPSKLFSYALSGKPLLACLRWESPAYAEFQRTPGLGHALWFDTRGEMTAAEASREIGTFLTECASRQIFDRRLILEPHLASAMARRHVELFEKCITKAK